MIKYFSLGLLLVSSLTYAAAGEKHRGQLVKVLSATTIQVKETKKPMTLTLRGVSDKQLTKEQKQKAVKYLKEMLTGQVLIWEEYQDGVEVSPNGVGQISRSLIEWGLVKLDSKAPESYKQFEELAKTRKVGIWAQK